MLQQSGHTWVKLDSLVTTGHFCLDDPSKQSKDRKDFVLLSDIPLTLSFSRTTWTYFPKLHSKGIPDAILGNTKGNHRQTGSSRK